MLLFVQVLPAVQVGPVGLLPILIERVGSYLQHFIRIVELPHEYGSLWKWQKCNFVAQNSLILLGLIEEAVICFFVLIQFEMLLHLLEGIEIFVLNLLHFLPFPLYAYLLHISFTILTIINQNDSITSSSFEWQINQCIRLKFY